MHNTIFSIPTCCKSYHCSWAAPGLLAPGCSWLLLGCSWLLLAAPGCPLLLLSCSWLPLAAPELLLGCFWLLLATKKANYARHSLLLSPGGVRGDILREWAQVTRKSAKHSSFSNLEIKKREGKLLRFYDFFGPLPGRPFEIVKCAPRRGGSALEILKWSRARGKTHFRISRKYKS